MYKMRNVYNLVHHKKAVKKSPYRILPDWLIIVEKSAFSLIEMLMALLVASLLMAALAPVMTRRMADNMTVLSGSGSGTGKPVVMEINYNSENCNEIKTDTDGSEYCEGTFTIPNEYGNRIKVTLIGAGGGGAAAPTAGYVEYVDSGNHTFTVPEGVKEIEATLVSGGGGGGAGYSYGQGYAYTHSGSLDRNYVKTSQISEFVTNVRVSGTHGIAVLRAKDIENAMNNKMFVSMSGGGGGGGRGYFGTGGGGGAAYHREPVTVKDGAQYIISVGAGGAGHSCNGFAGCGGYASSFYIDSNNPILLAGGGGGGSWSADMAYEELIAAGKNAYKPATAGEKGGMQAVSLGYFCNYMGISHTVFSGGHGALPNGQDGGDTVCDTTKADSAVAGSNGGGSLFGAGGIYGSGSHGRGYGAGGCGGGAKADGHGNGSAGFAAVEWFNLVNGGAGGGGGSILPLQKIAANPKEELNITVGKGGKGGAAYTLNEENLSFTPSLNGENGSPSYIKRGGTELLKTANTSGVACNSGGCAGDTAGKCTASFCKQANTVAIEGFNTTGGKSSANKTTASTYTGALTKEDSGGDGGTATTPFTGTCDVAKGGKTLNKAGGDAVGFGCGGGGGYGLARGGNGSGGYARISWNKYWDAAKKVYNLAPAGAGGGGASGNIFIQEINVRHGEAVKIRIGKGGSGGNGIYASSGGNAGKLNGTKGGDTSFGALTAGGGGGGLFPVINGANIVNGKGGLPSNVCKYNTKDFIDDETVCTKGASGMDADRNTRKTDGGKGADLAGYTFDAGGKGGIAGNNSNGANPSDSSSGAGGGGAGMADIGRVLNSANTTLNSSRGGDGANGKIIIEMYEF